MYANICNLVVVTRLLKCCSKKCYEEKEIAVEKKTSSQKKWVKLDGEDQRKETIKNRPSKLVTECVRAVFT